MSIHIVAPRIGWCREGVLERWLADDGEWVVQGHPLCLLRTEHSLIPILALEDGFFHARRPLIPAGTRIRWGTPLGTLLVPGGDLSYRPPPLPPIPPRVPCRVPGPSLPEVERPSRTDRGPRMSPRARHLVEELNIDLASIKGTGRGGRIRARDLEGAGTKRRGSRRGATRAGGAIGRRRAATDAPSRHEGAPSPFLFSGTWELGRDEMPGKPSPSQSTGKGESEPSSSANPIGTPSVHSPGLVRLILAVGHALKQLPALSDSRSARRDVTLSSVIQVVSVRGGSSGASQPSWTERRLSLGDADGEEMETGLRLQMEVASGQSARHQRDLAVISVVDLGDGPVNRFTPPIPQGMPAALGVAAPQQRVTAVAGKLQLRWIREITLVVDSGRISFTDAVRLFHALFESR